MGAQDVAEAKYLPGTKQVEEGGGGCRLEGGGGMGSWGGKEQAVCGRGEGGGEGG